MLFPQDCQAKGATIVIAFQFALLSSQDISDIQPIHIISHVNTFNLLEHFESQIQMNVLLDMLYHTLHIATAFLSSG
jgi:hypothetical protein